MTVRNDPLTKWADLFAHADAGIYDLPADLLALRAAVVALDTETDRARLGKPDEDRARADLVRAYVHAAQQDQLWPDPAPVADTARRLEVHRTRMTALTAAREQLAAQTVATVDDYAERIVMDYLRPRFDVALEAVAAAATGLPDDLTGDALLRCPDKVRKAWLILADLVHVLSLIRQQAARLNRLNAPQYDEAGEFAAMRNLRQVWPEFAPGRTPPWPADDARRAVLWQVRHGCELWLPTGAEQDARWHEVHGEGHQRMRRARQAAGMMHSISGGHQPAPTAA